MIISMAIFALSMSISPGPVNFLAMTSGLNCGFFKSLKFVMGATLGFTVLLFLVGYGLSSADQYFPNIVNLMKYVGCGYLIYLGIKIFRDTDQLDYVESAQYSPSFMQGWLLQWLNPKAWVACFAGCSAFDVSASDQRLTQFLIIYFIICFIGIASWALLGKHIRAWVNTHKHILLFNQCMGITLCALAILLLTH
jgi:threonine/homoserine/homoserine lactone efflux protein